MFLLQADYASKSKSQESTLLWRQAMPTSQKKQVATKQTAGGLRPQDKQGGKPACLATTKPRLLETVS